MTATRKDDHVRLAVAQHTRPIPAPGTGPDSLPAPHTNEFDDVHFLHHALAGIDRDEVALHSRILDTIWPAPIYINAMTGGTTKTGEINRDLATAARETGLAIATGSMSPYLKDPDTAGTFTTVRTQHPHGFVMANLNPNATPEQARRAVGLIQANALQIHLNTVQEIVMPEGDRSFGHWPANIEALVNALDVPVIVKEVGFGLSSRTITRLAELGVAAADVAGRGGTDFARIENGRRQHADYAYLEGWGLSTPAALLGARDRSLPLLASGGVRHPLDVTRALALGAQAVGVSGIFLTTLTTHGLDALITQITTWLDQLTALMTILGARTPAALTACDIHTTGTLRTYQDHLQPTQKPREENPR